ncbi:TonB-dependent receptor [Rurimicrobium arvi]|uniref:TonB-dependent receptor n=1 Tax=Rurimicrobium arvi TaxID=2049916 RepID=A0ABP8MUN8_9BACT
MHNFTILRKRLLFTFVCLLAAAGTWAQNTYTISGTIKNSANGEKLIDVIVQVAEQKSLGTTTNDYGFYSLSLKEGDYTIQYTYLGFNQVTEKISLHGNVVKNISLQEKGTSLNEVVVTSTVKNENVRSTSMGVEKLNMAQIKDIPVLFGERDVLKTLQLLPGVKSAGDGSSGFYVRGGGADQNLILLDEATVYNASHLLGFFSTFNSDAIKDVTLYKGNMPAQYGGRLASVMDVRMNDGNDQNFQVSGGIGLIASRLMLQGPIKKNKGSFLISGRRTYADMFLKLSNNPDQRNNQLYFYDLNLKANYTLNENNRLYLSGYFGKDVIGVAKIFGIDWGNATGTLRWNHIFNSKLFSNTSLIYSNYNYNIRLTVDQNDIKIISKIADWNLKQEFQWYANNKNTVKFGFNSTYHDLVPGEIRASATSGVNNLQLTKRYGWENAVFINNDWKASPHFSMSYGLRVSSFSVLGPGKFYEFDAQGNQTSTMTYGKGDFVKTYVNPEPRIAATYILNEQHSLKASYARNIQNMHLLSNTTSSSPTDRWITNSNIIKPEIGDQGSVGYYRNFKDNKYETSVEVYYKAMQNQVDYRDGAQIEGNELVEADLRFGKGRAYGAEFSLKKKEGKVTGWISYTLSRTERQIDGVNSGRWYPARQDQTHNLAVVGIYHLSRKWTVSGTFVYNTGNAVTFPTGKYNINNQVVYVYTDRNGYRMPAYHRLDLGATWKVRDTKHYKSEIAFSLYNAYGRENAYIINFRNNPDNPSETQAVQYSLFRWVPSVTWNFTFK